jgi:FtsH-binding integral membrane protein
MYNEYAGANVRAQQATLTGQVFGLLGFSLLFTMGGALVAPHLGPGAFILSLVGSFGSLIALFFLKDKSPINLGLFYLFSVAEGLLLGLVVESYLAVGMGGVVVNAAGITGALVLGLGAYSWTTKRDLSGMGGFLTIALIGVILASVINIFLHQPMLYLIISAAAVVIFSGFLMYDMQRLRDAKGGTGDAIMFAISIYLDIFNIFLSLLQILGILGGRDD